MYGASDEGKKRGPPANQDRASSYIRARKCPYRLDAKQGGDKHVGDAVIHTLAVSQRSTDLQKTDVHSHMSMGCNSTHVLGYVACMVLE